MWARRLGAHPPCVVVAGQVDAQRAPLAGHRPAGHIGPGRAGRPDEGSHAHGPAQVEVGVVLPREADAAEHLDAVLGRPHGGVGRHGRGQGGGERSLVRVGSGPCRVPRQCPRSLERREHVGAPVLHRLELADGPAELPALERVGRRRGHAPVDDPDRLGRHEHRRQLCDPRPSTSRARPVPIPVTDATRRVGSRLARGLDRHVVS